MTNFDIIVSVIVLIFITYGLIKGGIGTVLSMFKWYGAFIVSMLLYPIAKDFVSSIIQPSVAVNAISVIGIYVVSLIILSILCKLVSVAFTAIVGNLVDRALGIIIGLVMGVLIVSGVHFGINSAFGGEDPDWLKAGQTYELTKAGADLMKDVLDDDAMNIAQDLGVKLGSKADMNKAAFASPLNDAAQGTVNGMPANMKITPEQIKAFAEKLKAEGFNEQQVIDMIKQGKVSTEATVEDAVKNSGQ